MVYIPFIIVIPIELLAFFVRECYFGEVFLAGPKIHIDFVRVSSPASPKHPCFVMSNVTKM